MVSVVLDSLAEGLTPEQIVAAYPPLEMEDVRAAISYAAAMAREEDSQPTGRFDLVPRSALDEYKAFIDGLVHRRTSVAARMIRESRWPYGYPSEEDKPRIEQLLTELSPERRELLAKIVEQEREGGIHDALAFMTDEGYWVSRNGVQLAFEPYGTECYFDFVARLAGDTWPDERERRDG